MRSNSILHIVCLLAVFCTVAAAQVEPAGPASTPAPTTRPRREAVIPPGFTRIEAGGRVALVEQADESWVRTQLGALKPTTQPSVAMGIMQKLSSHRDEIIKQVGTDLALTDQLTIAAKFESDLLSPLQKLLDLKPPVMYLVCSGDKLRDLVKSGWQDPNFYFNRTANAVVRSTNVALRTDAPMDDSIIGVTYPADAKPEDKAKALTDTVSSTEKDLANFVDQRSRFAVDSGFAVLVNELAVIPLDLKTDQRWYGLGIDILLAVRYAAPIIDRKPEEMIMEQTYDNPRNPLRPSAIDLLHPPDNNALNPDAVPFYIDAVRRKSAAVMQKVIEKAGFEVVPATLTAVRAQKPADGAALVKIVNEKSGMNITDDLSR